VLIKEESSSKERYRIIRVRKGNEVQGFVERGHKKGHCGNPHTKVTNEKEF